jgi:DNA-binding response OmpR family regulator
MRILIAEDDKALGMFLSRGLEAEGYRIHLVHDGGAAVEAFIAFAAAMVMPLPVLQARPAIIGLVSKVQ